MQVVFTKADLPGEQGPVKCTVAVKTSWRGGEYASLAHEVNFNARVHNASPNGRCSRIVPILKVQADVCAVFNDQALVSGLTAIMMPAFQCDLHRFLIKGPNNGHLTLDMILYSARQVFAAVADMHAAGVLHGDIKPSNFFVDKHNDLLLGDLGNACCIGSPMAENGYQGTWSYMSPAAERYIVLGRAGVYEGPYDGKEADIWSAGLVVVHTAYPQVGFPTLASTCRPIDPNQASGCCTVLSAPATLVTAHASAPQTVDQNDIPETCFFLSLLFGYAAGLACLVPPFALLKGCCREPVWSQYNASRSDPIFLRAR